ncbi:uncharacterized protein LOC125312935 [Rhodamnia argentea]|uniref:Uncharacterized protein LOC125312935 n=1 Tax=Rhodamnia argentea TaxID=178133 RepID=A0ABM3GX92_9MYRT|nr:uncharacterized protein LOC125312935 [Rhodamnia argentea]
MTLFHNMMHNEIEVYVDDMIAKSRLGENHVAILRKLFERLRKYRLRLNPAKCVFGARSGKLLGFMVGSRGIAIDPSKVKAICELRPPSSVKEVRGLLGRLNYVARFISRLSESAKPFFKLIKKNAKIVWDIECQTAFLKIQHYPTHSPVLVPPIPGVPLILYPTIYKESLGAVLVRKRPSDGKECAIYYLSKKFSDSEANYSEVEKTCVALVWVLHASRRYTLHHRIMLTTECDPIKYLLEKPTLVGKLAKWRILISEFDVRTMTQKSVKGRAIADMLAENAAGSRIEDGIDPLDDRVLPITTKKWIMYFDGAVNLSGSGTWAVLISPDGQHYPRAAKLLFPCTNNIVEYEARILGLQAAVEMEIRRLQVYGDSALIILRTEGKWKTRDPKLIPYHEFTEDIIEEFDEIAFEYLPRAQNRFADALAILSSMFQVTADSDIEPLRIEILKHSAYSMLIEEEVDGEPRYQDIKVYPRTGEFPEGSEAGDRKYPMKLSSKFFLGGDTLYKRSYDSVLPRCVDAKEANRLMTEIHEGECGPHMNGHLPTKNVAGFLRRDIFARYGAPEAIITDNGSNLNNKVVDELLAVLPVETEIPSLGIPSQLKLSEAEWIQQRYERLNMIDEKRLRAICHGRCYQKRVANSFNRKVRPRLFKIGDLVLKKRLTFIPHLGGKFTPNYEGPYLIKKVLPGGALILAEMDGRVGSSPVNADMVKKYFP